MKNILSFGQSQDLHSVHSVILYPVSLDYSDTSNFGGCYFSTHICVAGILRVKSGVVSQLLYKKIIIIMHAQIE